MTLYHNFRKWLLGADDILTTVSASTLVNISGHIDPLIQVHVGFLIRWRRDKYKREQSGYLTRQQSQRLKFRVMRSLYHYCKSCYCHATNNFFLRTNYGIMY